MDGPQLASHKPTFIVREEDRPLGEPQEILSVFHKEGNSYVKVNMARDYKRADDWRVHVYLPLTFDVSEFRQRFSRSKHGEVMKELDQRVAELDKDRSEGKATVTTRFKRFSGLLQHILGCLPFKVKNHLADRSQEDESDRQGSTDSDTNDCKAYNRASQQPMILQRTSTGGSIHQVVSSQRADICVSQAAASNISISSDSTEKPLVGCHVAQPNPHKPQILLQHSLSDYALAYDTIYIRANTAITAEDTGLWIGSLEAFSSIDV